MIKGILIVNNNGVCRVSKFYQPVHKGEEQPEVIQQLVIRARRCGICHIFKFERSLKDWVNPTFERTRRANDRSLAQNSVETTSIRPSSRLESVQLCHWC